MNIVNTVWWQAIGVILFFAVIGTCLYCLRDMKREQREADAEAINNNEPEKNIYLKPPMYIYPKNDVEYNAPHKMRGY